MERFWELPRGPLKRHRGLARAAIVDATGKPMLNSTVLDSLWSMQQRLPRTHITAWPQCSCGWTGTPLVIRSRDRQEQVVSGGLYTQWAEHAAAAAREAERKARELWEEGYRNTGDLTWPWEDR